MNQLSKLSLIFFSSLLFHNAAYSTTIFNTNDPATFLGPTLKLNFTNSLIENTAYTLSGEVGGRNYRIGATYGFMLTDFQRLKVSGEWLWQNITYSFFSSNPNVWVNQGALGLAYQYDFANY